MVTMPDGYFSRFDAAQDYERHLYRVGRVVQGAELNETQQASQDRLKRISDVLFSDGAVIRDAGINVNQSTGVTSLGAGVIYARGAMRGIAPATVTLPLSGLAVCGIYLQESVVTELEDPTLKDPAVAVRNFSEPGAARLRVRGVWGVQGDGTAGDFFAVYTVIDGVVQTTQPPPQIDAVALAIAAYDRDSTGGHYIAEGLRVSLLADSGGSQVYSLAAGNARVNGRQVLLPHARRVVYPAVPDLKTVLGETKLAVGGTERVNTSHFPIDSIDQVLITAQKEVTLTHGAFTGATDVLPDSAVAQIVAVNQGGTWNGSAFVGGVNYAVTTDFLFAADALNWAPAGSEPAPGSTYKVVYRHVKLVTPTSPDATGFTVAGAVVGTSIQINYKWRRPRVDRLCLDPAGVVVWVQGAPNDVAPRAPTVSAGMLSIATVKQTWDARRSVSNDGTRVQTMPQLEGLEAKVDNLFAVVSEHQLKTEAALSDPTTKRGIFVDNFENDNKRDAGVSQSAAVVDGALTLALTNVVVLTHSMDGPQALPLNAAGIYPVIQQTLRTGCMLVNPYQAFNPIPGSARIEPATDFWTAAATTWASPVTQRFTTVTEVIDRVESLGWLTRLLYQSRDVVVSTATELLSTRVTEAEFLRPIVINFTLEGFGAGENLAQVKFDGIPVSFSNP